MLSSRLLCRPAPVRLEDPTYAQRDPCAFFGAWKMYVFPCSGFSVKTFMTTVPSLSCCLSVRSVFWPWIVARPRMSWFRRCLTSWSRRARAFSKS